MAAQDGMQLALKQVPVGRIGNAKLRRLLQSEVELNQELSSPNVIRFLDHFTLGAGLDETLNIGAKAVLPSLIQLCLLFSALMLLFDGSQ